MDSIGTIGDRAYTPAFSKMMSEGFVMDEVLRQDKLTFEQDWEVKEPNTCPMCHGTGHNPETPEDKHCVNCEGTGHDYIITYGVKSKQTFAYIDEYGMNAKKEFCKAMREAHAEMQSAMKVGNKSMIMPYALPKCIEMELIALGYNPNGSDGAEVKEIANWVAKNAPDYLCVNYKRF